MKKVVYGVLFLAVVGTTIIGCQKESINPTSNVTANDNSKYVELESLLKNDLDRIAQELRSKKSNFDSQSDVIAAAENLYSKNDEALTSFFSNYNSAINHQNPKNGYSTDVTNVIDEIEENVNNSNDAASFIASLDEKFNEIAVSNLQPEDKDLLLQYIVSYKTAITFIDNNQDLVISSDQKVGWWSSWGKCAAAIVGGAGLGALGGAAAGAPVALIGAIPGAIAGGIFGGLSGAAAGC